MNIHGLKSDDSERAHAWNNATVKKIAESPNGCIMRRNSFQF